MQLTDVSMTAVSTLRCRAIESTRGNALIDDPMAEYCVRRLREMASGEERALLFDRTLSSSLRNYIVLRARKYDALVNEFVAAHPGCLVVNLGCGFDTRYWRINHERCEYIELDLPEVVDLKREVLKDRLEYELIGTSVLDHSWLSRVNPCGTKRAILLAEGLLMYLPRPEVLSLFDSISREFHGSRMVLEVATEKYTHGLWKRIVQIKVNRQLGFDAGSCYRFGVRSAREIESYGRGLKVLGEWSYVEDPDVRPSVLRYLRLSRGQWAVILGVNEPSSALAPPEGSSGCRT